MSVYEFWRLQETDVDEVCALDLTSRLFDESLESNKLLSESIIKNNTVNVTCAKCGHCVLLTMQYEQPPDSNACVTA